ncbi:MAG: acetyl-CoA C-acetyltransferase [Halobacteriovoraceae bacterium]|nr:acetyl-CoA C-acetyltransferase [Halobacteriovoraceae bacterium]
MDIRKVAIIGGARIPFCKSSTIYYDSSNKEMMTATLKALSRKYDLNKLQIDEVCVGAVLKSSKDFSLARESAIDAGLGWDVTGIDIQMACGTSLAAAASIFGKIATGQIECGIAGGVDSSSVVPIEFKQSFANRLVQISKATNLGERLKILSGFRPSELTPSIPSIKEPRTGLSMGEHCELMAKEWNISREEQDQFTLDSHHKSNKAYEEGFMDDLVFEFKGIKKDNLIRPGGTLDKLGKLKPAFDKLHGTLTAANSSALTDGASCVFLCSEEYAKKHNLEIQSYLKFVQTAAVNYKETDGLLMAPAYAVPKMLGKLGLTLQDFDFYEIHEAFAAQVLCTLKAWKDEKFCKEKLGLTSPLGEIDLAKLNTKGSSLSLGHPFAATGSRILATTSKLLHEKGSGRGLISICTAGGMGITAVVEK